MLRRVLRAPGCLLRDHGCALHDEGTGVLPKSKVNLYAAIRRDAKAGLSSRALQRKYGVGFLTVQKALTSAWPEPRKKLPPRPTRLVASVAMARTSWPSPGADHQDGRRCLGWVGTPESPRVLCAVKAGAGLSGVRVDFGVREPHGLAQRPDVGDFGSGAVSDVVADESA